MHVKYRVSREGPRFGVNSATPIRVAPVFKINFAVVTTSRAIYEFEYVLHANANMPPPTQWLHVLRKPWVLELPFTIMELPANIY